MANVNNEGIMLKNKNKNKHLIHIVILLLLIGITFYLLLKGISIKELIGTLKDLNFRMVVLGLVCAFGFVSCEAMVLKALLSLFRENTSFLQTLKYSVVGFYFSSITPSASGGQPMQIYHMKKDNINISYSSLTILITLAIYQIVSVFYVIGALLLDYRFIMGKIRVIMPLLVFGIMANIIVLAFIITAILSNTLIFKIVEFIINFLSRIRLIKNIDTVKKNIHKQIHEYRQGAILIGKNPKVIIKVFALTFIQLTGIYSVTFFVYKAFGLNGISYWRIIGLQAIAHISVSSLPLPGSVGVSEGVFMLLSKSLFPVGILSSAMLINRGLTYYIMLIISASFVLVLHIYMGKSRLERCNIF